MIILNTSEETNYFSKIVGMIEFRKANAYRKVNEELILLYWDVGKYVSQKIESNLWGSKVVDKLSLFIKEKYPTVKGFTKRNIERMVQFYKTYKDDLIATPLVTQLSWTNNLLILSGSKSREERYFYLNLSIKENYSKRELERQICSSYYERYVLSNNNPNLQTIHDGEYPNTKILDTYSLEFFDFPNVYSEKDLRKSIIQNLKKFILEIGKSFTFVGIILCANKDDEVIEYAMSEVCLLRWWQSID